MSCFLALQDALEVLFVTKSPYFLTHWLSVSIDFTDVTLVSEDTDEDDEKDEKLYSDKSYLVIKVGEMSQRSEKEWQTSDVLPVS